MKDRATGGKLKLTPSWLSRGWKYTKMWEGHDASPFKNWFNFAMCFRTAVFASSSSQPKASATLVASQECLARSIVTITDLTHASQT